MKNRSIKLIIFGLCAGALIGTLVGNVLSFLLPDGSAVKQFFLISYDFTFGSINVLHLARRFCHSLQNTLPCSGKRSRQSGKK